MTDTVFFGVDFDKFPVFGDDYERMINRVKANIVVRIIEIVLMWAKTNSIARVE
jgi:hypothetical protein